MHRLPIAHRRSPLRTRCVWLVLLALVWSLLAPQLLRASASAPTGWLELCTAHGVQLVQVQDAGSSPSASADSSASAGTGDDGSDAQTLAHCPFCRLHDELVLGPPGDQRPALAASRVTFRPLDTSRVVELASPRLSAQPRAPPRSGALA